MSEINTNGFGDVAGSVEPKRRGRPKGSKNAGTEAKEPIVVKSGLVLLVTLARAADLLGGESKITAKIVSKDAEGNVSDVGADATEFSGVQFNIRLTAESLTDRDLDFPTVDPVQATWRASSRNLGLGELQRGARALHKLQTRLESLISQAGDPSNLGDWLLRFANNVGVSEVTLSTEPGVFHPTKEVRVKTNQFVAALKADVLALADAPAPKVAAKEDATEAA